MIVPTRSIVPADDDEDFEEDDVDAEPTETTQPPAVARTTTIELDGPQSDEDPPGETA